jgi:hypothetical protein
MTLKHRTHSAIDIDKAKFNPAAVFRSPEELADHPDLAVNDKIEILRRWQYDAAQLAVAEEEGMKNNSSDLLGRISVALDRLTGGFDVEHGGPTKLGGLPKASIDRTDR